MGKYLVYIGPNRSNSGKNSSKGYWIRRRRSEVRVTHGPIDSDGARGGRYYWRGGRVDRLPIVRASEADAEEYVRRKIRDKTREGYDVLENGVKIRER